MADFPIHLWSDLKIVMGGATGAFIALGGLLVFGWLGIRFGTGIINHIFTYVSDRSMKNAKLLEMRAGELNECAKMRRLLEDRVVAVEDSAKVDRAKCDDQLHEHKQEIHVLRESVLDLKAQMIDLRIRIAQ